MPWFISTWTENYFCLQLFSSRCLIFIHSNTMKILPWCSRLGCAFWLRMLSEAHFEVNHPSTRSSRVPQDNDPGSIIFSCFLLLQALEWECSPIITCSIPHALYLRQIQNVTNYIWCSTLFIVPPSTPPWTWNSFGMWLQESPAIPKPLSCTKHKSKVW